MPIPHLSPEPTAADWQQHRKDVAQCRANACFAALANHFGTESPNQLERRVDRRDKYVGESGDSSWSGKYRRWLRDGIVPGDDTVAHVFARSGGSVQLARWRDLALWELLAQDAPDIARLHAIKESFSHGVRRILFDDTQRNRRGRFLHFEMDRERTLLLRDLRSLDGWLALLCVAREGEILSHDPRHCLPTRCAFDVLPYILHRYAQLRFRWESLFARLERIFFLREYTNGAYYTFPMSDVTAGLATLDADPAAQLEITSGIRARRTPPVRSDEPQMVSILGDIIVAAKDRSERSLGVSGDQPEPEAIDAAAS